MPSAEWPDVRALLLIAGFWAGLSAAQAADDDFVSRFQRFCMGPGPFRQSLIDFAKASGWWILEGSRFPVISALSPQLSPAGKLVDVSVHTGGELDSCRVQEHGANMDQHLDRVRSTLGLVGPGETPSSHLMNFLGREGSDEKALQWALSSESSDYVILGESERGFAHIYLVRLRSPTREKP
jgi:hypothetical protein